MSLTNERAALLCGLSLMLAALLFARANEQNAAPAEPNVIRAAEMQWRGSGPAAYSGRDVVTASFTEWLEPLMK